MRWPQVEIPHHQRRHQQMSKQIHEMISPFLPMSGSMPMVLIWNVSTAIWDFGLPVSKDNHLCQHSQITNCPCNSAESKRIWSIEIEVKNWPPPKSVWVGALQHLRPLVMALSPLFNDPTIEPIRPSFKPTMGSAFLISKNVSKIFLNKNLVESFELNHTNRIMTPRLISTWNT
jgi:hypothetical protein